MAGLSSTRFDGHLMFLVMGGYRGLEGYHSSSATLLLLLHYWPLLRSLYQF